jgi:hypothetical protein
MGFYVSMLAIQIEPRRYTATHFWIEFHESMSAIQIDPEACTATHFLDGIS